MDNEDDSIQIHVDNIQQSNEFKHSNKELRKQDCKIKRKNQKLRKQNHSDTFSNKLLIRKDKTNLIHKNNFNRNQQFNNDDGRQQRPFIKQNPSIVNQQKNNADDEFDIENNNNNKEQIDINNDQNRKNSKFEESNTQRKPYQYQNNKQSDQKQYQQSKYGNTFNKYKSNNQQQMIMNEDFILNQSDIQKKRQEQQTQNSTIKSKEENSKIEIEIKKTEASLKKQKRKNPIKQKKEKKVEEQQLPILTEQQVKEISEKKAKQEKSIFSTNKFEDLNINVRIISALQANNYQVMTKIQQKSIPEILSGQNCVIKSETGSGKTLAYMVPIIQKLLDYAEKVKREDGSHVIIICPTRELCIQCVEIATKLVHRCIWIIVGGLMGGEDIQKEKARIRKGLNILCATPGRLLYHLKNTQSFKYNLMKFLVFEESDIILDMGFKKDLEEIISILKQKTDFNSVQKILISANYSQRIETLYLQMSKQQIKYIGFTEKSLGNENDDNNEKQKALLASKNAENNNSKKSKNNNNNPLEEEAKAHNPQQQQLKQSQPQKDTVSFIEAEEEAQDTCPNNNNNNNNSYIESDSRLQIPASLKQKYVLLDEENRIPFLCAFLSLIQSNKVILFVATCDEVEYFEFLFKNLLFKGQDGQQTEESLRIVPHTVFKLHGSIPQKERSKTYFSFKKATGSALLISTDVASRGLDFQDVSHTILFDVPGSPVEYCNRIGRTARIDMPGVSLLLLHNIEHGFVDFLKREAKIEELEQLDEWNIINRFSEVLRQQHNVGMEPFVYIQGIVKYVFHSNDNQLLARRAYVSSLRAYSRLCYKNIFVLKQLNLKNYAKTFGLERVRSEGDTSKRKYQTDLRGAHKEKFKEEDMMKRRLSNNNRKPRNIVNDNSIYKMEFM